MTIPINIAQLAAHGVIIITNFSLCFKKYLPDDAMQGIERYAHSFPGSLRQIVLRIL